MALKDAPALIETVFPAQKVSFEAQSERKAVQSQTKSRRARNARFQIGRIKRFGQRRETVDMLNLVFEQTVDETIYERLSERMKNRYDLFGSLPDTIKDEWIEDIETLGERLDDYINAQKTATGFDLRYTGTMMPPDKDWREFTEVLSRRDLATLMSSAWT
ncbi:MAG: hypothetical protein ACK5RH_05165 [Burkholderiales bacterium]|nr:hypothetical protein [Burkholderiales bacterium]